MKQRRMATRRVRVTRTPGPWVKVLMPGAPGYGFLSYPEPDKLCFISGVSYAELKAAAASNSQIRFSTEIRTPRRAKRTQ